jgi:2-polyprenyl-3-methyl-5-hydroxy-6-metoxy-1,4-benzoquinol methylase
MVSERKPQLAYSELEKRISDEPARLAKGDKIAAVLGHFLGRDDLEGLDLLDVGCSVGIISGALAARGARVTGVDIDEPGLAKARARHGDGIRFLLGDGQRLPVEDASMDVVVFNHIYEHVVDPPGQVAEVVRVLKPGGVAYHGRCNRLGLVEPHYRLPFLSWLSPRLADGYLRLTRRGDHYYERMQLRSQLRRLFGALELWDYTLPVLADPTRFDAHDVVPGAVGKVPRQVLRALLPVIPTYIWVGVRGSRQPAGPPLAVSPQPLRPRRAPLGS